MIFLKETTPHLPIEQTARGGPVRLGLVAIQTSEMFELPDVSYVTIPIWDVNTDHITPGKNVLVMWKITNGLSPVSSDAVYTNLNSLFLSEEWIRSSSPDYWNIYSSGRWSVMPSGFNAQGVYTWQGLPLASKPSLYNPIGHGGHVGVLYFNNWNGDPIRIPGSFGRNGGYIEWLLAAEVVGSVIYPTRIVTSLSDGILKKITKTTSGIVTAANISDHPVNKGKIPIKSDDDLTIPDTLNAVDEETSVILMPCGIDSFSEVNVIRFYRPGSAIPIVAYNYTGPRGFAGGLVTGQAFDASIDFAQTRRVA